MYLGAGYYLEYQPYERMETDIRLMRETGFTIARLADSLWATYEPADGEFRWGVLARVLDALHDSGIWAKVLTPTYAIPPWLFRKHPEIMAERIDGRRVPFGARQNVDVTNPTYRFYAERIIRRVLERYAQHPAIAGFQVDNEAGLELLYNHHVFAGFIQHLRRKFETVERLNDVWGLAYWSHRLTDWDDLWTPVGNTNPQYDLEWRRYQSGLYTDFLAWQAGIVREYARPDQWITHDAVGGHSLPGMDRYAVAQNVDILSENVYHATQEGLTLPHTTEPIAIPDWLEATEVGVWTLSFKADLGRGAKGPDSNFIVTETNASSIDGSWSNAPAYDGQWRLVAYHLIARGATAIIYWPWATLHYGSETHWGGVLPHDGEPGSRCQRELSRLGAELKEHDSLLTGLTPDADVAFLYSLDTKYSFEFQPALAVSGHALPDRYAYGRIFNRFYESYFNAGAQTAIVHPEQRFEDHALVVVPALYIADDTFLRRLVAYAEGGGHLVIGFRTGYADEFGRARWDRKPGALRAAVGASYQESSNLAVSLPLRPGDGDLEWPADARAEAWAEGLELEGAVPLAWYDHRHFGRFPAVTTHEVGAGRVSYVGTLPNPSLGEAIARWTMRQAGVAPVLAERPAGVHAATARAADGRRLWFLQNWSWEPQTLVRPPATGTDILAGDVIRAGDDVLIEPWNLRIIVEDAPTPST